MLWIIFAVLLIRWLAGSVFHFGVGLMNILCYTCGHRPALQTDL